MSDEIKTTVRTFVVENFLFGDDSQPLASDLSFIDNDLIDSTGILELVGFLEERFAITVADADIVPANLDTIDRIAGFIARKQAA
ncbi:acyl carrier protein [Shinella daejeonensis]|uniref:acyl carrier protein n=1 Tax=Shinella daejeonensis TaxID=659017 RepID=UPI0020C75BF0|nr:acyl carrier protein [Shinella daejeonensis]MCP8895171.1 acyl carrier protein [Shinella daejeonensis]